MPKGRKRKPKPKRQKPKAAYNRTFNGAMFFRKKNRLREAALFSGWLVLGFVLLSLVGYSADDPGWSLSIGGEGKVDNYGGYAGAFVADVLLSLFGRSAFLLAGICLLAWHVLLRRLFGGGEGGLSWPWITSGVILFILSASAIEYLRFYGGGESLPAGAGGFIGAGIGSGMMKIFGFAGAALILKGVWMISCSLAAGLSWLALFEGIGEMLERYAIAAFNSTNTLIGRYRSEQIRARRDIDVGKTLQALRRPAAERAQPVEPIVAKPAPKNPPITNPQMTLPSVGKLPSVALLDPYPDDGISVSASALQHNSRLIEKNLLDFGVSVLVEGAYPGPVITRYDIRPATGVKGAQVVGLMKDLARAMSVGGIRILETIEGRDCMGLEIPNNNRRTVYFSELAAEFPRSRADLPLALGKDASGKPVIADLAGMPHLLAAGATGSGKSVCINAMLLSLLYAASPEDLRLILIDPKMLELSSYDGIPHLMAPVVTDMAMAPAALNWGVGEMERRYALMSKTGARNIASYNKLVRGKSSQTAGEEHKVLPFIVIVIDELADLMMVAGKKVELTVSRLAQKARAAGIHLILATQRPSVDVITGLIKANIPSRVAFQVASKVDSRTIIDQSGAESLLGKGDMLYLPAGSAFPRRVHGAFVSDSEVQRVVEDVKKNPGAGDYAVDFSDTPIPAASGANGTGGANANGGEDSGLYKQAVEVVLETRRPSISLVQRKLRIGYNRAARLIEEMETAGLITPPDDTGTRKIITGGGK
ncbi:MAG: DNA translocase FtsK [Gammaproteobacteria bacterium]